MIFYARGGRRKKGPALHCWTLRGRSGGRRRNRPPTLPHSPFRPTETPASKKLSNMDKLFEFGRKAWFMVRVLSGYEERRIRSYRLQLQKRIQQAQARRVELRRIPEQTILKEVRRMVEEMRTLNHNLEEIEAEFEEYFKPIDKNAEIIMNMQLEKEEKQLKEMMKVMQEQAMLQREMAQKNAEAGSLDRNRETQHAASMSSSQEQTK